MKYFTELSDQFIFLGNCQLLWQTKIKRRELENPRISVLSYLFHDINIVFKTFFTMSSNRPELYSG